MIDFLFSSIPLLFASVGALFSEYAGVLAVFIDGVINLSAFLTYTFTIIFGNIILGILFSSLICVLLIFVFAAITQKLKMNCFLSATAINLFSSSLCSVFSSIIFKTRGVLFSPKFSFNPFYTKIFVLIFSLIFISLTFVFLFKTPHGLYLRITGSNGDVLNVKGISDTRCKIYAWTLAALFASFAGSFLALKINSYVPNISAGRGWIALATVFIGKKKLPFVAVAVLIFCIADYIGITLQAILPSSAINSIPFIVALILISISPKTKPST